MSKELLEGMLLKRARSGRQSFQSRWIVLSENSMKIYKTKQTPKPSSIVETSSILFVYCEGNDLRVFTKEREFHFRTHPSSPTPHINTWAEGMNKHTPYVKANLERETMKNQIRQKSQEMSDAFEVARDAKCDLDAVLAWAELAVTANKELIQAASLGDGHRHFLENAKDPNEIPDDVREEINKYIDAALKKYREGFLNLDDETFVVPGVFSKFPAVIEMALAGRCLPLEAHAAGHFNQLDEAAAAKQRIADLSRSAQTLHFAQASTHMPECAQEMAETMVKGKVQSVAQALYKSAPGHLPSLLDAQRLAEAVCDQCTSTVANHASKTAVQLCYGVAGLIMMKPSQDRADLQHPSSIIVERDRATVEVASTWWAVEDQSVFWLLGRDFDPSIYHGAIEARYSVTFQYSDWAKGHPPSPFITVKKRPGPLPPLPEKRAVSILGKSGFKKSVKLSPLVIGKSQQPTSPVGKAESMPGSPQGLEPLEISRHQSSPMSIKDSFKQASMTWNRMLSPRDSPNPDSAARTHSFGYK